MGMISDRRGFWGLRLDIRRQTELADDICARLDMDRRGCFRHLSLNAVKFAQACRNRDLWRILTQADCLSADGMGIVWAARLLGIAVPERVTGIDLMQSLLPRFEAVGHSVFLLGARAEVLDRLQKRLRLDFPHLIIAGAHHGYEANDAKLAEMVRRSGADTVFVALPSPRKDSFVINHGAQTGCRFVMGVGGAFDVLSGDIKRAPEIWQRYGLEFAWRMVCAPRVMVPRYVCGLAWFARIVIPAVLMRLKWRVLFACVFAGGVFAFASQAVAESIEPLAVPSSRIDHKIPELAAELADFLVFRTAGVTGEIALADITQELIVWLFNALTDQNVGDAGTPEEWFGNLSATDLVSVLSLLENVLFVVKAGISVSGVGFLIEAVLIKFVFHLVSADFSAGGGRVIEELKRQSPNIYSSMVQISFVEQTYQRSKLQERGEDKGETADADHLFLELKYSKYYSNQLPIESQQTPVFYDNELTGDGLYEIPQSVSPR